MTDAPVSPDRSPNWRSGSRNGWVLIPVRGIRGDVVAAGHLREIASTLENRSRL